jgi:hypothetical protein
VEEEESPLNRSLPDAPPVAPAVLDEGREEAVEEEAAVPEEPLPLSAPG